VSPGSEAAPTDRGAVRLTVSNGIACLVLCREPTRNAISPALLAELERALAAVERAENVKLLVLEGEGNVFSIGVDLPAVEALPLDEAREFFGRGRTLVRRLEGLNVLTVAAVNGLALGGGFELALACDLRWAHARAVFGFPECKLGLIPGWGGIRSLRRHLPSSLAFELLARGNFLGVRAAHACGLVSRVFEGRDFQGQVHTALEEFRARDAGVLRALKALARDAFAGGREAWDAAEAALFQELWSRRASAGREAGSSSPPEPGA
jgi:enoyl-CoA hydratase/carnithine racemase